MRRPMTRLILFVRMDVMVVVAHLTKLRSLVRAGKVAAAGPRSQLDIVSVAILGEWKPHDEHKTGQAGALHRQS
ncbi:hypothetical protein MESS2_820002 [Mesorhizobium metallidurans STM 2683]|uniref:Uncharacterized protein n=1 Tax=Mesorhizobium metallidurans STM 2683 TaxID=1297569 RepID=M5EXY3_9HYPH|nr:hypothetical protein MESS2_820002 [Mesorhizobium metallidurans STM 2683]